jgi:hypothetical protein
MSSLTDALTSPEKKAIVIDDCLALIDAEVADKGGLSGLAIKAGYGVVKGIRPGFIKHVVTDLLPEFAAALDPIWQDAQKDGKSTPDYFSSNATRVADALLAITDAKSQKAKSGAVKSTYDKLRGTAKKNVEAAVPRLGKMVEKHAG